MIKSFKHAPANLLTDLKCFVCHAIRNYIRENYFYYVNTICCFYHLSHLKCVSPSIVILYHTLVCECLPNI